MYVPGGDFSMECPDVCAGGLKMYKIMKDAFWFKKKHTHIERILHTHIMV